MRAVDDLIKSKEFFAILIGPSHTLPPPTVLFQSFFDKVVGKK